MCAKSNFKEFFSIRVYLYFPWQKSCYWDIWAWLHKRRSTSSGEIMTHSNLVLMKVLAELKPYFTTAVKSARDTLVNGQWWMASGSMGLWLSWKSSDRAHLWVLQCILGIATSVFDSLVPEHLVIFINWITETRRLWHHKALLNFGDLFF